MKFFRGDIVKVINIENDFTSGMLGQENVKLCLGKTYVVESVRTKKGEFDIIKLVDNGWVYTPQSLELVERPSLTLQRFADLCHCSLVINEVDTGKQGHPIIRELFLAEINLDDYNVVGFESTDVDCIVVYVDKAVLE